MVSSFLLRTLPEYPTYPTHRKKHPGAACFEKIFLRIVLRLDVKTGCVAGFGILDIHTPVRSSARQASFQKIDVGNPDLLIERPDGRLIPPTAFRRGQPCD